MLFSVDVATATLVFTVGSRAHTQQAIPENVWFRVIRRIAHVRAHSVVAEPLTKSCVEPKRPFKGLIEKGHPRYSSKSYYDPYDRLQHGDSA